MSDIRVLILGTGGMANTHAEAYAKLNGVRLVGGVDTNPERLAAFQKKHDIEHGFTSVEDALAWGDFDAVSNVTPDAIHHVTTLPLLAAGKHVLCEKPLAVNETDAAEMAQAAESAGVINMVNLTYRNGAALPHAAKMVADGAIGEVRHFEASYLQSWLTQPLWGHWDKEDQWLWRLSTAHGSNGCLGDTGIHIIDFATLIAGSSVARLSARLKTYDKAPNGKIEQYVLDANDGFAMHCELENGAVGVIHGTRMASGHINDLRMRIFGTKGGIEVRYENDVSSLTHCGENDMQAPVWNKIEVPDVKENYARFIDAICANTPVFPDFARAYELQKVLDRAVQSDAAGMAEMAI